MSQIKQSAVRNRLLAALPSAEFARLAGSLTPVTLSLKQPLFEADEPIEAAYFIETGMVSYLAYLANGNTGEVGIIGSEGMVGMPLILGVDSAPAGAVVQMAGTALRISPAALRQAFNESGANESGANESEALRISPAALRQAFNESGANESGANESEALRTQLLRYMQALFTQVSQTAVCNANHSLEERLARWLLMAQDRAEGDEFPMTHEFMAMMLGVRRAGVTVTAGSLKQAGLIRYAGGQMTILDRPALESVSCECYGIVQRHFEQLLGNAGGGGKRGLKR